MGFTPDQQIAFEAAIRGQSVFISGPAGTGKSYLIKELVHWAAKNARNCAITATTGNAAFLIGGRTLHSFLGIGLANATAESLAARNMKTHVGIRVRKLHMLIIDEISMISDELLDKISEYLSILRKRPISKLFGGIQMIFVGDPCQLPPVNGKFCFQASSWAELAPFRVDLTTVVRQENDPQFRDLLNRVRWGQCSPQDKKVLKARKDTTFSEWIQPTRLYALNTLVDQVNQMEFDRLLSATPRPECHTYLTKYSNPRAEKWAKSCAIPHTLQMAVGAQVVVTFNVNAAEGIVNGTRGVVCGLTDTHVAITTKEGKTFPIEHCNLSNEDDPSIIVQFMPLKLAYALTIHKAQGMTLDAVELDLGSSIFEYGQAYTALSRARDLNSVKITRVRSRSFRTHPAVLEYYGTGTPTPAPPAPPTPAPPTPAPTPAPPTSPPIPIS